MKKKLTALLTASLTAFGCLSGNAQVFAVSEAEELYTLMQQENGFYTPVMPAEESCVNYWDFDMYEGLAVRCKDDAGALPTVAEFMQQHLSSGFGGESESVPFRSDLPADSIRLILNSNLTEEEIAEILADERYEVLGTLRAHYQKKAFITENWDHCLMIVPAEGCTLDAAMLNTDEYGHITNTHGFWMTEASPEEAVTICEKLTALDTIEYAWPAGSYHADLSVEELRYFAVDAYGETTPGDLDVDGSLTVSDAIMLARVNAEDCDLNISKVGLEAADYNRDSCIDVNDLTALLDTLAGSSPD